MSTKEKIGTIMSFTGIILLIGLFVYTAFKFHWAVGVGLTGVVTFFGGLALVDD